ncbi:UNVERIFIED_CONTAM: hypothetical protein NY603_28280, partial [Bacteroidetes bacterium 56_B9]
SDSLGASFEYPVFALWTGSVYAVSLDSLLRLLVSPATFSGLMLTTGGEAVEVDRVGICVSGWTDDLSL